MAVAVGSLFSTPIDPASRHPSKSSISSRTTTSNGSRTSSNSVSSTSSRPQGSAGDPPSRASVSKAPRLSGSGSNPASLSHPNSVSPPFSTTHVGQPGQPTRRRDTSFVGTRSSAYRMSGIAAPSARPSSPAASMRPQTPVSSGGQDLSDHPVPVPSAHVVGQRIAPAKSTKTAHVTRRNSNS